MYDWVPSDHPPPPMSMSRPNPMSARWRRCGSAGFTLIELLLALTVLAVAASLAVPAIRGIVTARQIVDAADSIELQIKKQRTTAIRTGQIQMMRFAIGGRQFTAQPWLSGDDAANAAGGATVVSQTGQVVSTDESGAVSDVGAVPSNTWELGESVIIADAQMLGEMRASLQTGAVAIGADGYSPPLLFYPDGSSSTAQIILQNDTGRRIAIAVRGITGSVQIFDAAPAGL